MSSRFPHALPPDDLLEQLAALPEWALFAAAGVTERFGECGKPFYCLPAGVKLRLTLEVAKALMRERTAKETA